MLKDLQPRSYQISIAQAALKNNTLVVLPTGMGKTIIGLLVAAERLKQYPESKVLIVAPTRPLSMQHKRTFEKFTDIRPEEIVLVTGRLKPEERIEEYKKAKIVTATPQTIKNDLNEGRLSLADFSLLIFDEAHRAVKNYPYPFIAKKYMLQAKNPLILALTASPGATKERIEEIMENLFIKSVEIRSETDEEIKPYVKEIEKEFVYVELPEEFKKIRQIFQTTFEEILEWLKMHRFIERKRITRKELLALQKKLARMYIEGNKNPLVLWATIKSTQAIKLQYLIELLETQDIEAVKEYVEKLLASKKRGDRLLVKTPRIAEALQIIQSIESEKYQHPKISVLLNLVKSLLESNPSARIIVFANYRKTVEKINKILQENSISSRIFIGQFKKDGMGMSQTEQIETLKDFEARKFNVLVATSIGEEGLDIPSVEYVVFYEPVPSEIRTIQRRGRVGRQTAGKVFFLVTKDTLDEAYFFAAIQKEKKMKKILYGMKKHGVKKKKETLLDWIRP